MARNGHTNSSDGRLIQSGLKDFPFLLSAVTWHGGVHAANPKGFRYSIVGHIHRLRGPMSVYNIYRHGALGNM